tara:strand:- start:887 stop:2593 length:1707 start_codon:yes stop_codon:yes gene_type:complete
MSNFTLVSGLWNMGREDREFESHYMQKFSEFLEIDANMILFLPKELEEFVWERRSPSNTFIKVTELEDLKTNLYAPHWDKTQGIRNNPEWQNITGEGGWLKTSAQASLEYYNPVVMSKMFMLHDAVLYNNFNTEYFYWMDAGITNTVPKTHLVENKCLDNLVKYTDNFLFLSWNYDNGDEIHGFKRQGMDRHAGKPVTFVCRGGLFGGHGDGIRQANSTYYSLLNNSLSEGLMGTEESIFAIMATAEPGTYRRFLLDDNGLIVKFTQALVEDSVQIVPIDPNVKPQVVLSKSKLDSIKTNLYILTFNFPEQLLHTINSMKKTPEWLKKPHKVLLDNSTDENARVEYEKIAKEYDFEYIWLEGNKGICGGRQVAAEHFEESDADFYFFFEDDMTSNPPELDGKTCRNGLRKYVHGLYDKVHRIIIKEKYDYLKLSFTEVYWDNDIQTSWYNVPQDVREKYWPDYSSLPTTGRDPNAPRTKFNKVGNVEGLAYLDGEVTYTNWPMIMSREGNRKVFIETKWNHPFEQTWMSHVFQKQKESYITAGVLLASPIWHDRIKYYKPEERRENAG